MRSSHESSTSSASAQRGILSQRVSRRSGSLLDQRFATGSAVRYWISSGKKESEVAHELGVSGWSLSRWRRALEGDTTSASDLPGITEPNALELAREVGRLRRENEALTRQRDILKKAISIFSMESPHGGSR